MNWKEFKSQLNTQSDLVLNFQYQGSQSVKSDYHITEIKQADITSVDCGGKMNHWQEVIVQLWEPPLSDDGQMTNSKAVGIINKVEEVIAFHPESEVKIEFGNDLFAMRQMSVAKMNSIGTEMRVELLELQPECKALGRGDSCGKPKIKLSELKASGCAPDSGCC